MAHATRNRPAIELHIDQVTLVDLYFSIPIALPWTRIITQDKDFFLSESSYHPKHIHI